MRLTFERDLDLIRSLASAIADAFVKISHRRDWRDDAESDAILKLVETEFDESKPGWKSYVKERVLFKLIRNLQTQTGRRLKKPPEFTSLEFDLAEPEPTDCDRTEERAAIARALERFDGQDRLILNDFVGGKTPADIASAHNVSVAQVSKILAKFKSFARFYRNNSGVAIVETRYKTPSEKEKKKCPLFYTTKSS